MILPTEYSTPIQDAEGKWYLCRPILITVSGGKNVAYILEDGTEVKREPLHRYKQRVKRRENSEQARMTTQT